MTQHNPLTTGGPGSFTGISGGQSGEWVESWSARVRLPAQPLTERAAQVSEPQASPPPAPEFEDLAEWDRSDPESPPPTRRRARSVLIVVAAVIALAWSGFVVWLASSASDPADVVPVMAALAAGVIPVLLIVLLAAMLISSLRSPSEEALQHYEALTGRSTDALKLLAQGRHSLDASYRLVESRSEALASATDQQARALQQACEALQQGSRRVAESLSDSMARVESGAQLLQALEAAAPRLKARVEEIRGTIARCGMEMAQTGEQAGTMLAGHAQATAALARTIEGVRHASADAGEELVAMAATSTARIDLVLDRARIGLGEVHDQIEMHNGSVDALVSRVRTSLGELAGDAAASADRHLGRLDDGIKAIDQRIRSQAEDHMRLIAALQDSIDSLDQRLTGLDSRGGQVTGEIDDRLAGLCRQTEALDAAMALSGESADRLKNRSEAMLLALDSNLRELDESLPAALDRADARIRETQASMAEALASGDRIVAAADGVVERLEAARAATDSQAAAVAGHNAETSQALAAQGESISMMKDALEETRRLFATLRDDSAPKLLDMLQAVRASTGALAEDARKSLAAVIEEAGVQLGEAGREALDNALRAQVRGELSQLAEVADNTVKATHRATDHLLRQMLALTDSATEMERRISGAARAEETRERDFIGRRSAAIITSLQDNAIDIAKWLDRDIGDKEWAAYLNGDKSLFSRRAVKLLGSGQAHALQAHFREDPQFAEQVSRYIDGFEALIRDVLAARDGHSLAIALLSSDVGKLYVALAQATERLRAA